MQFYSRELLLQVFTYLLDVVTLCWSACVSKYWHQIALDGSNWQHVDLFRYQICVKAGDFIEKLSGRCGGFLKSLNLHVCENTTDSALRRLVQICCCNITNFNRYPGNILIGVFQAKDYKN